MYAKTWFVGKFSTIFLFFVSLKLAIHLLQNKIINGIWLDFKLEAEMVTFSQNCNF